MDRHKFAETLFYLSQEIKELERVLLVWKSEIKLKKSNPKHRIFQTLEELQQLYNSTMTDLNNKREQFDCTVKDNVKLDF